MNEWRHALEAGGFKPYPPNPLFFPHANEFWQRWIWADSETKAYAVNAFVYYETQAQNGNTMPFGVMFEAVFYLGDIDKPWFSVTYNNADSVYDAMTFFAQVFEKMNCINDPHNN